MKAVFLDRNTLSRAVELTKPMGISQWMVYESTPASQVVERLRGYEIAIVNKVKLTADILQQLPDLKLIQLTATGMDNVDLKAAESLGIEVKNVAGYSTESVAEHFFMLLLAVMRGLKPYHQAVEDGTWQRDGRFCLTEPTVFDLHTSTLGIIGIGSIGRAITDRAKAFGMKVLWAERQGATPRNSDYTDFDTVLSQSDIISLNCPLTSETHHLVDDHFIAKLGKKAVIVNVARGGVVDSQAIYNALMADKILGFAADVFENEPPLTDDPLLKLCTHPRVWYTPHSAWASDYAQNKLWTTLKAQVEAFIEEYK